MAEPRARPVLVPNAVAALARLVAFVLSPSCPPLPMVRSKHLVPLPPSLVGEKCGRFWCHINFSVADSAPKCFAGPASTRADRGNGEWLLSLFPSFPSASLRNSASWKSTQSQFSWQSHRWNPPGHSWSCHVDIPPPKSPWVTAVPALGGLPPDLPHLALSQAAALSGAVSGLIRLEAKLPWPFPLWAL